jgi:hypothetical protein
MKVVYISVKKNRDKSYVIESFEKVCILFVHVYV